jgi:hypothetical protein
MKLVDDEKVLLRLGITSWTHRFTLVCHFCLSTWQPGYKKENCKGIDYFNRGESVHSVPATGNEKPFSHEIESLGKM